MFDRLKRIYWNTRLDLMGIQHGKTLSLIPPVYFRVNDGGIISLGDNVSLNTNTTISAANHGTIQIGNNVSIGQNTVIRASNHNYESGNGHIPGSIVVEDDVWIGANCVILPRVRIGEGAVIGAGSIVTKDIPSNVVAVGNPCKPIKEIERTSAVFEKELRDQIERV